MTVWDDIREAIRQGKSGPCPMCGMLDTYRAGDRHNLELDARIAKASLPDPVRRLDVPAPPTPEPVRRLNADSEVLRNRG